MWFLWHKNVLTTWESPYFANNPPHTHTILLFKKKNQMGSGQTKAPISALSLFLQDSHGHCEKVSIVSIFRTQLSLKYATSLSPAPPRKR